MFRKISWIEIAAVMLPRRGVPVLDGGLYAAVVAVVVQTYA